MAAQFVTEVVRTEPATYTPTINNTSGIGSSTFKWWQDGKWLNVEGQILYTSQGTVLSMTVSLPNSLVIDTNHLVGGTATTNAGATVLGDGAWLDSGTAWKAIWPKYVSTTTVGFWVVTQAWSGDLAANGDSLNFRFKVPIVGW